MRVSLLLFPAFWALDVGVGPRGGYLSNFFQPKKCLQPISTEIKGGKSSHAGFGRSRYWLIYSLLDISSVNVCTHTSTWPSSLAYLVDFNVCVCFFRNHDLLRTQWQVGRAVRASSWKYTNTHTIKPIFNHYIIIVQNYNYHLSDDREERRQKRRKNRKRKKENRSWLETSGSPRHPAKLESVVMVIFFSFLSLSYCWLCSLSFIISTYVYSSLAPFMYMIYNGISITDVILRKTRTRND